MRVVLDANVVAAAVCWSGEAYLCLVKLARRQAFVFGTSETLQEAREIASRLIRQKNPKHNAAARLTWYLEKVKMVDAGPLGKQRSRDPKDDPSSLPPSRPAPASLSATIGICWIWKSPSASKSFARRNS